LKRLDSNSLESFIAASIELRERSGEFIHWLADEIMQAPPRIVGCTSVFSQHTASLAILRELKQRDPSIVTVIGGANCESQMGLTTQRKFDWLDYTVSGEADEFIAEFFQSLLAGNRPGTQNDLPYGVLTEEVRSGWFPGTVVPRATTTILDEVETPDYRDYFATLEHVPETKTFFRPSLLFETSRGCWWGYKNSCTFCGLNGIGKEHRTKSDDRIYEEVHALYEMYGLKNLEATDNILAPKFFRNLLPRIASSPVDFRLFFEVKSNLSREQVQLLHKAGVIWVQPGIENLHSKVLALMNKGCKGWENIRFLKYCLEYGVRPSWNILWGFPNEKEEWYRETAAILPGLVHLPGPGQMIQIRYDRFSHYHQNQKRYGIKLTAPETMRYIYPTLDRVELDEITYFFDEEGRNRVNSTPFLQCLFLNEGIEKMKPTVNLWISALYNEDLPVLEEEVVGASLVITDTRPVAEKSEHRFHGARRRLYESLRDGLTHRETAEFGRTEQIPEEMFRAYIDEFIQQRLVLDSDGVYLSLSVPKSRPDFPRLTDYPGGYNENELERMK
jgi:ribosomal peptide maturation radical SAM protein 1